MMLATVVLVTTGATFWSLQLIHAPKPPDPGNSGELAALAPYIAPLPEPQAADTSYGFMLPLSDPFDHSSPVSRSHLVLPPLEPPPQAAAPVPVVVPETPHWVLKGTLISPAGRTAMVDDSIVTVGSKVRGGRVTVIENLYIEIVDTQGKRHVVRPPLES